MKLKKNIGKHKEQSSGRRTTKKAIELTDRIKKNTIYLQFPGNTKDRLVEFKYPVGTLFSKISYDFNLDRFITTINGEKAVDSYRLKEGDLIICEYGNPGLIRKTSYKDWLELAEEISSHWQGPHDAVEEIRYQRSKNG